MTPADATTRNPATLEVSATGNLIPTTSVAITNGSAVGNGGGIYNGLRGTMTTTNSPITANTPNNCVGSTPAVPNCTG